MSVARALRVGGVPEPEPAPPSRRRPPRRGRGGRARHTSKTDHKQGRGKRGSRRATQVAARRAALPAPDQLHYPPDLPVSERREEIRDLISQHQVVIVAGETGSGKTTQLPKICLELGRGVIGMIGEALPDRNRLIVDLVAREAAAGCSVLVLSGRVDHCQRLANLLNAAGTEAVALTSRVAKGKRSAILDRFRDGTLKVVCATGNGTAGAFAPEALRRMGVEVIEMDCDLDNTFPKYNPNPEDHAMLSAMAERVRAEGADLALGFDGDGDRCGVVDDEGEEIFADKVGVLLGPEAAAKATHFFQLCDQSELPIIFLNNTTGYIVGTESEHKGMIKLGSKMIQAVSNVRVPKLALYIGASFGAGNYGMSGVAFEPDFLFSWPNAKTGVMAGASAANTMSHVARVQAQRKGEEPDEEAIAKQNQRIRDIFEYQESAFFTSGRVLDHGVIDPRDTRKVLGFALETIFEAKNRTLHPNAFGVARI